MSRPPTFVEIGQRIKKLRENRGLTQEKLSRALGVTRPVISKIESGKKALNSVELRQIADCLQTSTDFLTESVGQKDWRGRFRTEVGADSAQFNCCAEELESILNEVVAQIESWRSAGRGYQQRT